MQIVIFAFFGVFLTSRLFSETLRLIPKFVDVMNLAVIPLLFLMAYSAGRSRFQKKEENFVTGMIFIFMFFTVLSAVVNYYRFFLPSTLLFIIGFIEGPLLFLILNRSLGNAEGFTSRLTKGIVWLLYVNLAVVVFINMPRFLQSKNPDLISGTFGFNPYYFSNFLMICCGVTLALYRIRRWSLAKTVAIQAAIIITFYLLQYRSALLFFVAGYVAVFGLLFGRQILRQFILIGVISFFSLFAIRSIVTRTDLNLKYNDWYYLLTNPTDYLQYGKFQAYTRTVYMMVDNPYSIIVGVGPGNYLSRAYYTFGQDLGRGKEKGVTKYLKRYLGMSGPRFTRISEQYLAATRTGAVFGSNQLSNPNTSFLAPIAEIGIPGGMAIIGLYLFMLRRAFRLLRLARQYVPHMLPLASGLVCGVIYLFGLGFLENCWEMSRITLPIWLLFWATSHGVTVELARMRAAEMAEGEVPEPERRPVLPGRPGWNRPQPVFR